MGWFDEQIRQREKSDQNVLEDSFFRMAGVVMDKWNADRLEDGRLLTREALDDILKFYHQKPVEIPEDITDAQEQLEYVLRPTGLMVREVRLEDNWQNDAFGPMLGYLKETGQTVALMPPFLPRAMMEVRSLSSRRSFSGLLLIGSALNVSSPISAPRTAFIIAISKVGAMDMTSPVAFICVPSLLLEPANLSNGHFGNFATI